MSNVDNSIKVPIYRPNDDYREWLLEEVYTGPHGTGVYVPKLNDSVRSWATGVLRCIEVNESTGITVLIPWVEPPSSGTNNDDVLLGVGPGTQSESYRLWVDKTNVLKTATPDGRLHMYSQNASHYKIFRGYVVEGAGAVVVSAWYNQNETWVSENIPMSLAATDLATNLTIKAPMTGYVTEDLMNGEPVTLVFYGDNGKSISRASLLVELSTFVRGSEASQRYITGVFLDSPFMSESEQNTLLVPMNMPVQAIVRKGRVTYSNGDSRSVPIDGNKMSLEGLRNYVATIHGQRAPLMLVYKLSDGEAAADVVGSVTRTLRKSYYVRTDAVQGAYSVKLFIVPQWVDEVTGWRLDYFLYNLDRQDFYYATPFIEPGINSAPFDPLLYGTIQDLVVSVDLDKLDSRLEPYRHVQTFSITLMGNGIEDRTPWYITHSPGQNPPYGGNLKARVVLQSIGNWEIFIDCGLGSLDAWLQEVYYRSEPLFDSTGETKAPAPTHFIVSINGIRNEYPISEWNTALPSITGGGVGKSLIIEWIRKVSGITLQMGCSPLVIVQEL